MQDTLEEKPCAIFKFKDGEYVKMRPPWTTGKSLVDQKKKKIHTTLYQQHQCYVLSIRETSPPKSDNI